MLFWDIERLKKELTRKIPKNLRQGEQKQSNSKALCRSKDTAKSKVFIKFTGGRIIKFLNRSV